MPADRRRYTPCGHPIFSALTLAIGAILALIVLLGWQRPIAYAIPTNDDVSIDIEDHAFVPAEITITVGTKVVWENVTDDIDHTVVFTDGTDSGLIEPGKKYDRIFDTPGTYTYVCSIHEGMTGVIHVVTSDPGETGDKAELSVTSRHDQPLQPGAVVDYHILYENSSDTIVAQNGILTVTLPGNSTLLASRRDGVDFPPTSQTDNVLVYALGAIAADSKGQIDLQIQLPANLSPDEDVALRVRISADNVQGNEDDDSSEDSSHVSAPRLSVGVRPAEDSDAFAPGRNVTYTVAFANRSDEAAADAVTITVQLPAAASFVSALRRDDDASPAPITPDVAGNTLSFFLGVLEPESSGRIFLQLHLADTLSAGERISVTATIASATATYTSEAENQEADDTQTIPSDAANLYVRLSGSGDGEVGGHQRYQLLFGNAGLREANDVLVTLTLPTGLDEINFGATPPTTFTDHVAVWGFAQLDERTAARPILVDAVIRETGPLTATASITGHAETPESETESQDNEAVEAELIVPLTLPTIVTPKGTIGGTQPIFRGLGTPQATVSLYLSGTMDAPGRLLGVGTVQADRSWVISPTAPITITGWHWVTATQSLNGRTSATAGASFVVSDTLPIDPDSIRRNGQPVGGLNPTLWFQRGRVYQFEMTITACAAPISPTMRAFYYNNGGLLTGYQDFAGTQTPGAPMQVSFVFTSPLTSIPFELYVNYDCAVAAATTGSSVNATVVHHEDCFIGVTCSDDPPHPPEDCSSCQPGGPVRPVPVDPDGFVYDAVSVRAGSTITQSIITQAWVTATIQVAPGQFGPWNALEYNQINPQYTDSAYPDKVLTPGYYSFLVPPGFYRIQVDAPGFLPYESQVVQVVDTPVTLHVPLERSNGALVDVNALPPVSALPFNLFLPAVDR